jgi:hypothetical protein
MANSTDLSRFRARHEKLVIVHGVSDPILSVNDTIHWYEQLNQVNQGRAAEFVRMFAVPGMNHCGGGPATDQFDAFAALAPTRSWRRRGRRLLGQAALDRSAHIRRRRAVRVRVASRRGQFHLPVELGNLFTCNGMAAMSVHPQRSKWFWSGRHESAKRTDMFAGGRQKTKIGAF